MRLKYDSEESRQEKAKGLERKIVHIWEENRGSDERRSSSAARESDVGLGLKMGR
jgi:hypothetical protein